MVRDQDLLNSAKSGKKKAGRAYLLKYLEGGKITRSQAIKAKCYSCNGYGEMKECDIEGCPLLPYSPYKIKNGKNETGKKV